MTWTININGHDDLTGDEKAALEEGIVERARALVTILTAEAGNRVSTATVTTNTTGSVNVLT